MATKTLTALSGLLLLAGCGDMRERELAEQVMAAKVAAQRAEEAQAAAEKAAGIASKAPAATVEEAEEEPSDENQVDVDTESGFVDADAAPNPARANAVNPGQTT